VRPAFCRRLCGTCPRCVAALAEIAMLDAVYATLAAEDVDAINRRDADDPRTYALDAKGRP
jgi:LDH2 family malate/lactate/ureidoglycolate dehydrogenase